MNDYNLYIPPTYGAENFHCPFCTVHAKHYWRDHRNDSIAKYECIVISSKCNNCEKYALWVDEGDGSKMVYPKILVSPIAHQDMPESVRELYDEARNISIDSPRAAAALLRCAIERLAAHLGEKDGSLNTRIGNLVKKGLPKKVQEALDIVRITANEGGSHCGEIDLGGRDGVEVVGKLFWMVNFIIDKVITEQREIEDMLNNLPEEKREGISKRDDGK